MTAKTNREHGLSRRALLTGEALATEPGDTALHIASLIVYARPEHLTAVAAGLGMLPGVEVAATDPPARLVVTVEAEDDTGLMAAVDSIHAVAGVLLANLVYHYHEAD